MGKKKGKDKQPHKGHQKHACALFAGGDGLDDLRGLARNAAFICVKCGRVAEKKKNVCKSAKL